MTTNKFIMMLALATWSVAGQAQTHRETITKTLQFERTAPTNVLYVANINGNIRAEGYNGSTIQIEVVKKINAKTESWLEEAKALLELGTRTDHRGTSLQQRPELLCLGTLGFERSQRACLIGQVTCQQPGILWVGLITHIDRFPVVNQLARVDEINLKAQCMGLFDKLQVIT